MRHVIIGTAGHVDHGKTCLIKALTGIDTDRLKEEKKRGITIELGFAYLDFPDGRRVGIVDVPGHEKFVKNMLAGAGGIDIALLVVAADEGVMPQTVEHLDILSILGIPRGVVVLTKSDLVEPDFLQLVEEDVRELLKGTFLEQAPIVPVSVFENQGLENLKNILKDICDSFPQRKESSGFRLPIDRVFTLKGFGTIVTGTLMDGKMSRNQNVVLYPENVPVKIRSIQVHAREEETAWPGQRAAVNLPDRKKEEISRGDVLAPAGSLYPTRMLDGRVEVLKHAERTIKSGSRVHIYLGTRELLGKIILMEKEELKAGESGYAQLRLEEETVARKGDHFVLRFYSPVETIGGGVILDACPGKRKKHDRNVIQHFVIKESGTVEEQLELAAREHWGCFYTLRELAARSSLSLSKARNAAVKLVETKRLTALSNEVFIHCEEMAYYEKRIQAFLKEYHTAYPLREGMAQEEVRSRLSLSEKSGFADDILRVMKEKKLIKEQNGLISSYRFRVIIREDEDTLIQEITEHYLESGFAPLATELYLKEHHHSKKFQAVFHSLLNKKILIRLDDQYCIHNSFYEKAKDAFREMAMQKPVVLGEFRDYLGCSRKVAVALLEHFDKRGFTRKTEEGRILKTV
ncbi:MAG: selenocysteine-specific translation elongation factor [Oliverpabstia sp.]